MKWASGQLGPPHTSVLENKNKIKTNKKVRPLIKGTHEKKTLSKGELSVCPSCLESDIFPSVYWFPVTLISYASCLVHFSLWSWGGARCLPLTARSFFWLAHCLLMSLTRFLLPSFLLSVGWSQDILSEEKKCVWKPGWDITTYSEFVFGQKKKIAQLKHGGESLLG